MREAGDGENFNKDGDLDSIQHADGHKARSEQRVAGVAARCGNTYLTLTLASGHERAERNMEQQARYIAGIYGSTLVSEIAPAAGRRKLLEVPTNLFRYSANVVDQQFRVVKLPPIYQRGL